MTLSAGSPQNASSGAAVRRCLSPRWRHPAACARSPSAPSTRPASPGARALSAGASPRGAPPHWAALWARRRPRGSARPARVFSAPLARPGVVPSWTAGARLPRGLAPAEIIGEHFSRFYTEVDRTNGKPLRALRIAREQGRYEEEGWRVRKDGTFFWASVIIDPIYEDGQLVGFAKITRAITHPRQPQLHPEQCHKQLAA